MRRLLLFFFLFVVVICNYSSAQIYGANQIALPGHWLEIGQNNYGAFGSTAPPAGYHPYPAGSPLAEVYDYGHDGWTTGAPPLMGDYTYPGSPYEGWGIQVNGTGGLNWAFTSTPGISGTGSLTGANTTYVNAGGALIGNWAGTAAGGQLRINMETRVDTNASWVVVTAKLYNTGATTLNNIYYFRGCDPDNDEAHGGSFATNNYVNYQNDVDHRVGVAGIGETYTYAYLQLCTKDCRAKALIHVSWPINYSVTDLSTVYSGTAAITPYYNVGVDHPGDIAIGLVYQLGNLCPGDSTFVSYAYTFLNTPVGIDSAFPEPTIVVNGVPVNPPTAPSAIYDTFNACLYPGMTTLPIDLSFAATGAWTWSQWNWSPGTGLASTTGTTNTINLLALPPSITYTITGTAYNSCGGTGTGTCGSRTVYLTVLTCNGATVNSPCIGGPLDFNAPGDSTGATYQWYGPAPSTGIIATTQSFTMSPSTWADTGTYHVIKTVAGTSDTSTTVVILHPKPNVSASSNSPLCSGAVDTLRLYSTTDIAVTTYSWSGPAAFIASIQNPTRPGFTAADSGMYTIIVSTAYGCMDTATTHVLLLPPPGPPIVTDPPTYCYAVPFVPFSITPATGATVYWYPTPAGGIGATTVTPTVNTSAPGTYTFYYGQTIGSCESPIDSITIVVYPPIIPNFSYAIHHGCVQDTVYLYNTSTGATSDMWNFGDGTSTSTATNPMHIYTSQSSPTWTITLTDYFATCSNSISENIDTRHTVQAAFMAVPDTLCAGLNSAMVNLSTATVGVNPGFITSYLWNFDDGTTDPTPNPVHVFNEANIYNVILTVTDSIGCTSTFNENVYVIRLQINSWLDTTLCLRQPLPLINTTVEYPDVGLHGYTYLWTPSTNLSSDTAHIPFFDAFGTYTYTLTTSLLLDNGDLCTAQDVMVINSVLGRRLQDITPSTTISYGTTIQLNADSLLYYWWIPDNGTLNNTNINNPLATPDTTTMYTVYGMDQYGCVDSGFVTIRVDSSMHECIPSGFTPNGDGLNDYFRPLGLIFQGLVDFRVYNRWGQQVFYTSNKDSKGWDGTYNGVVQDMGTYYYSITVARPGGVGENIVYKGDVTLIR